MREQHLEPAKSVISKIGIEKVAEVTGKHVSRVYRWMYPKERGGTGGFIPPEDAKLLLAWARDNAVPLSASEFLEPLTPERLDAMFESMGCRVTEGDTPATGEAA